MKSKTLHYSGEKAAVSYDVRRCIHAAECVHGLPDVFDPGRKPWIDPDRAEAEQLLQVIMSCPTGALHLERSDDEQAEPTPERNIAAIEPNGPVYLRGDMEIVTRQGDVLLKDTRIALCRCGNSENKPLCDGQHTPTGFEDGGVLGGSDGAPARGAGGGVRVTAVPDGPLLFKGPLSVVGSDSREMRLEKGALCRCGASENKPFCDGSHVRVGFAED